MRLLIFLLMLVLTRPCVALDAAAVGKLAFGDAEERSAALAALVAEGDPKAVALLEALAAGDVQSAGERVLIVKGEEATDAATGAKVSPLPKDREDVVANNRLRREIESALSALKLLSPDRSARLAAAQALSTGAEDAVLPLVKKAMAQETDPVLKPMLELIAATLELKGGTKESRIAAVRRLSDSNSPNTKTLLMALLEKDKDGKFAESDEDVRAAAQASLRAVEGKLVWGEMGGLLFAGISLGSILLLAALGLAITYGLMGVINMAHGELMALGAYATFVVQNWFRATWPAYFDSYFLLALPVSFLVAAAVGLVLERGVIRFLYGRPLETLLLTWGASLIIQQGLRLWFGAANVDVSSPSWLSGGATVMVGLTLPYNRIFIIGLATVAVAAMYWLLFRTNAGLRIRAVTQNRAMSSCLGVRAGVVDATTFAFGAGLAGLAGCALTQIGNVGPSLGQNYIVDSFMVVVTGGVGKLAGTILASAGLGGLTKGIEPALGAVFGKVAILIGVILFLQRRPAGLFATRGRNAEA